MSKKQILLALVFAATFVAIHGQKCNSGCDCQCICPPSSSGSGGGGAGGGGAGGGGGGGGGGAGGTTTMCPMCPSMNGTGTPSPSGATSDCDNMIRAAAMKYTSVGTILGAVLNTLLSELVIPILSIVLFGNNTVEGAVIPLTNTLCYIVGLVLLLLQNLRLLGILGMGGLLANLLGGITGK